MKEITGEEFVNIIHNSTINFISDLKIVTNKIIHVNLNRIIHVNLNRISTDLTFENVIFKTDTIKFSSNEASLIQEPSLRFENCNFSCSIMFDKIAIDYLSFELCKFENKSIYLRRSTIKELTFAKCNIDSASLNIRKTKIVDFDISDMHLNNGNFNFISSEFDDLFAIVNSNLESISLANCKFEKYFDFISNTITGSNFSKMFRNCQFNEFNFNDNLFQNIVHFFNCTFQNTTNFQDIKSHHTEIKFENCKFEKYAHFNRSSLKKISFDNIQFNDIVSFQEGIVETIEIDRTNFEKLVLFDEFKILKINLCNRRTLRIIKQQLQKAENKIDYNRFRSYELSAYYNELKWNGNFKDKFILWATKWSTGFEHSWRRALVFTLVGCLLFYSLFFISENFMHSFDLNYTREYLSGYFRFLIVTDFYNPLSSGREYIHATNTIGWFIFILGKIVIAFGIYEMIQAFRKFKA